MNTPKRQARLLAVLLPLVAFVGCHGIQPARQKVISEWVHPGPSRKLVYKATPRGDKIMDFSHAGYMGGGVALPTVPVRKTVQSSGSDDDTATIQAAINEVAAMKLENGFRGAVLLASGTFTCSNTIVIPASGVVLRGSGSGADEKRSTIKMVGRRHGAIAVRSSGGKISTFRGRFDTGKPDSTDIRC
jgi:hypothetical protein